MSPPFDPQIASQLNDLVANSPQLQWMHQYFDSMLTVMRNNAAYHPVPCKSRIGGYYLTTIKNSWEVYRLDDELNSMLILNGGFDVMACGRDIKGWFWMYWRPRPSVLDGVKDGYEPRMFVIALKDWSTSVSRRLQSDFLKHESEAVAAKSKASRKPSPAHEDKSEGHDAGEPCVGDETSILPDNEGWQLVEPEGQDREVELPAQDREAETLTWRQRMEAAADVFNAAIGTAWGFGSMAYGLVQSFQGPRI